MSHRLLTLLKTFKIKVVQENYQITNYFPLRSYQIQRSWNGFYKWVNPASQTSQ